MALQMRERTTAGTEVRDWFKKQERGMYDYGWPPPFFVSVLYGTQMDEAEDEIIGNKETPVICVGSETRLSYNQF